MSRKIPRGEDHLNCPLWQKPMSEVCHKCPWWVEVRGANPQTGEDASDWQCAITWGPLLAINIAQQARQTGAAVESFRNETVRNNAGLCDALIAVSGAGQARPILQIESENDRR